MARFVHVLSPYDGSSETGPLSIGLVQAPRPQPEGLNRGPVEPGASYNMDFWRGPHHGYIHHFAL